MFYIMKLLFFNIIFEDLRQSRNYATTKIRAMCVTGVRPRLFQQPRSIVMEKLKSGMMASLTS